MDTNESFHYGERARLHQGTLGKSGAFLPGWRRVRERIGHRGAQEENWMKFVAVSAPPSGRCYPSARYSRLQPPASSLQSRRDTSPHNSAPNSLKTNAGHPKEVRHPGSSDLHQSPILYTRVNMNRNRRNPLKTNDPCTLYSKTKRVLRDPARAPFCSTIDPNRNNYNSLKTKDRYTFYSTISRGVFGPLLHQSPVTTHHSLRGFHG
jgi:hypothetical protein